MKTISKITAALIAVMMIVFAFPVFAQVDGADPDSALDMDIAAPETTTAASEPATEAQEPASAVEPTAAAPVIINIYNGQNGPQTPASSETTTKAPETTAAPETTTVPEGPAIIVTEIADQPYTGSPIRPAITIKSGNNVLVDSVDYRVSYTNNTNVGTAAVIVEYLNPAFENFGQTDKSFSIIPADGSSLSVTGLEDVQYTGTAVEPELVIKHGENTLLAGSDYSVKFTDNVNVSTADSKATCFITFKGNYTGTKEVQFNIKPRNASSAVIDDLPEAVEYRFGRPVRPGATVKLGGQKLKEGKDYELVYTNNKSVGTGTVTAEFKGNYTGSVSATFRIDAIDATCAYITYIPPQLHTGSAIQPSFMVFVHKHKLTADTDYTVAYSNNTNLGTATVTVTFKGDYSGTATTTFEIVDATTIAQTGEFGVIAVGVVMAAAGVTFAIVKKKKNKAADEEQVD